jgi:hypothetical protein
MYTIQPEGHQRQELQQKGSVTRKKSTNPITVARRFRPDDTSVKGLQSAKEELIYKVAKPTAKSWSHRSMNQSVRDLMSELVDSTEEVHMNLPCSKKRCTDRSKILMYMPFSATLKLPLSTMTGTSHTFQTQQHNADTGVFLEPPHSRVTDDALQAAQMPIRRRGTSRLLGGPVKSKSKSKTNNKYNSTEKQTSPLLPGECYPRFRLDTIVGRDDLEASLCSFRASLEGWDSLTASSVEEDNNEGTIPEVDCFAVLERSESFVKEQDAIWSQIAMGRRTTTHAAPSPRPNTVNHSHHDQGARDQHHHHHHHHQQQQQQQPSQQYQQQQQQQQRQHHHHNQQEKQKQDFPGANIKVLDQERVYAALNEGSATIVQCIGCNKHMLATSDIHLILCPACGTLTPLDFATALSSHFPWHTG